MEHVLGFFIDKQQISAPGVFFQTTWESFMSGPEAIRPTRCGNYEPLQLVEKVDLARVLSDDFIARRGRMTLAMVKRPAFPASRYFTVTLILRLSLAKATVARDAYDWMQARTPFSIGYRAQLSEALFRDNIELHQMLNSGLVEMDLERVPQHRAWFEILENAA